MNEVVTPLLQECTKLVKLLEEERMSATGRWTVRKLAKDLRRVSTIVTKGEMDAEVDDDDVAH
jgi:hypothetical protein